MSSAGKEKEICCEQRQTERCQEEERAAGCPGCTSARLVHPLSRSRATNFPFLANRERICAREELVLFSRTIRMWKYKWLYFIREKKGLFYLLGGAFCPGCWEMVSPTTCKLPCVFSPVQRVGNFGKRPFVCILVPISPQNTWDWHRARVQRGETIAACHGSLWALHWPPLSQYP